MLFIIGKTELIRYVESDADVNPGEMMKLLVDHVIAKAGKSSEDKNFQELRVSDGIAGTSIQARLLNLVNGQSVLDNLYKERLQEDVLALQNLRQLYMKYRSKEIFPPSCPFPLFLAKVVDFTDSYFKTFKERPNSNQVKFCNFWEFLLFK